MYKEIEMFWTVLSDFQMLIQKGMVLFMYQVALYSCFGYPKRTQII